MPPPLNPAQAEAVKHHAGPLLVLAGAGSGKTRVITHRIAALVARGVPAKAILALTFTNKAAGEMAERAAHVLKDQKAGSSQGLTVCTFHAFGLQVLTRERKVLGGTFTLFDQGDSLSVVKEILARMKGGKSYDASAVVSRISNAKNGFVTPQDFIEREGDEYDEMAKIVYPRYVAAMRNFRAYDFDDLVCEVARLWTDTPEVLARWQERYRYILVDEYQDTNRAQLALLTKLADAHKNICVVGDDDQSIYAWRGADVRNILDFEEHFAGAQVIKLEQNYRSDAPILDVANAVIGARKDSKYKKFLMTDRTGGARVGLGVASGPESEAKWVVEQVRTLWRDEHVHPRDIAILFRSNSQGKLLEEFLREHGIPYRLIGGQQFFERKEVKDCLSFLKVALNRRDELALRRVINYPPRGIGETSIERLGAHAMAKGWTLWETIERVSSLDDIPAAARTGCQAFEKLLGETRKRLMVDRAPASVVLRELVQKAGIRDDIHETTGSANGAARRTGNMEALCNSLAKREQRSRDKGGDPTDERELLSYLHALTLNTDDEDETATNTVTLSTLHGSKGLEFDHVFLVGCEEGFLPHQRTLDVKATDATVQDVEEERRLFYVGVTRAKKKLIMTRCKMRMMRGKPIPRTPSRFLSDIPEGMIDTFEVRGDTSSVTVEEMAAKGDALLSMLNAIGK